MKTLSRRARIIAAAAALCLPAAASAQRVSNPTIEMIPFYTCVNIPYYLPLESNKTSDYQEVRIYKVADSKDIVVYENNVCTTAYVDPASTADPEAYTRDWGCQNVVSNVAPPDFKTGNSVALSESNWRRKIFIDPVSGHAALQGARTWHDDETGTYHTTKKDERIICKRDPAP